MRYLHVSVARSENLRPVSYFPGWEVALLQHVHGIEAIEVVGEDEFSRPWPRDAAAEYDRLALRYGKIEGTDQTIVSIVYGPGVQGMQRLAQAMAQAKREADENPIDYAARAVADAKAAGPKIVVPYDGFDSLVEGLDSKTIAEAASLAG